MTAGTVDHDDLVNSQRDRSVTGDETPLVQVPRGHTAPRVPSVGQYRDEQEP